ncbi:MAG: hypothetical protein GY842_26520 [bacterium]|nr:hypothetical protein [bacterium]
MRNCIILGSGRSGTSMVAGALSEAGYYMGDRLYPAREANPKGFFESPVINRINEDLLAQVLPYRPPLLGRWFFQDRLGRGTRWMGRITVGTELSCPPSIAARMRTQLARKPYCFKDPRYSYTLPAWRPHFEDTVFVCVFREPMVTVESMLKECATARYLRGLQMDVDIAVEVWSLMYEHILRVHRHEGEWLFLHYSQVLAGDGLEQLAAALDVEVNRSFPEERCRRSVARASPPAHTQRVYEELCRHADYRE